MSYHVPVLLQQSVDALVINPDGVYVDVTFGGGGHSRAILHRLSNCGKLYAFDQDSDVSDYIIQDSRVTFIDSNFRNLKRMLRAEGVTEIDGLLADLGVSSHQFDVPERGFSFRFDSNLDMRMNQQADLHASEILMTYTKDALQILFGQYGEVRNAKTLAAHIVQHRATKQLHTVQDFVSFIEPLIIGERHKYLAQVFQALRIEVNDEMKALEEMLAAAIELLKREARLVVISYHSLEDRLVKNFIKSGNAEGIHIKDFFGNIHRPLKPLFKDVVLPSAEELKANSRARSAKMRVAEKM
ncbi:MAG: 16S rRNA (cytosine(1402)-N(4))-methyltransferase RsmH [Saprospiraceae bacterium]|nr:16S rRNA (cytosine(1402)-N(4))-methyltransferase RsmH [Saprospiraceae bacterium]